MTDLSPARLLELYWQRSHTPRKIWAAVPKTACGDRSQILFWSVGREDLSRRLSLLPNPDAYDICTFNPPEPRTQ